MPNTDKLETFMKILYGMLRHRPQKGSPAIAMMAKTISDRHEFLIEELGTCDVTEVLAACWKFGQLTRNLNPRSEAQLLENIS